MAKKYDKRLNRLTDTQIRNAKGPPWRLHDGGGLYLLIARKGNHAKSGAFGYAKNGKNRWMGLGPYPTLSLAELRKKAQKCRHLLAEGFDPLEEKRGHRLQASLAAAKTVAFAKAAEDHIVSRQAQWKDALGQAAAWRSSFRLHCAAIAELPVAAIDTAILTEKVLGPLWHKSPNAARKLRMRIEQVLDAARVKGLRPDVPNPARWKGHLDKVFVSAARVRPVTHFAAVPLPELPLVMARLRERTGLAAAALELLALTAVRSEQVRRATWSEIDLATRIWTSPPEHVKGPKGATRPHRIPLSPRAVVLLANLPRRAERIFAGMPYNGMRDALREFHPTGTPHGLRSAFKDWARQHTEFPDELSELALDHAIGDSVRKAYARSDMLEERRPLMEAWAAFLSEPVPAAAVIPLRRGTVS